MEYKDTKLNIDLEKIQSEIEEIISRLKIIEDLLQDKKEKEE